MKTKKEIEFAREKLENMKDYSGMTYKQGIEEALSWVLCEIEDDEFSPLDILLGNR